jgi:deoxyadenosine/deoxycytidine kinase
MSYSLLQKAPIISIEGNIGSGKSTLMTKLKSALSELPHVVFLQEPVDDWNTIRDENGVTMLEKFYGNQEQYSFSFQMMAYISRLATIRKAIHENPDCVFISERCLHTDKYVFAKMLYDDKKIESVDYQIYNKWFDTFIDDFDVTNIVYIKADPAMCLQRVAQRGRDGEGGIPIEYLQACGEYHNNMMTEMRCNIHVLDGNVNINTSPQTIDNWIYRINNIVENVHKNIINNSPSNRSSDSETSKSKID